MTDLFRLLFDWKDLHSLAGIDAVIYAAFALLGTTVFVLRLGLALFLGVDGDVDFDIHDIGDSDGDGFGLISVLSVTAFLMGTGWAGLIAQLEWELSSVLAAVVAVGVGAFFMVGSAGMMFVLRRAVHEVQYNPADAVGKVGTVYMEIPAKGHGNGKIRVDVQGRSVMVDAVSTGEAITSFSDVRVTEARDEKTLIVEPM